MGLYGDQILPRVLDFAMGFKVIAEERKKCLAEVSGRVLEIGFGSGHNLPFYPKRVETLIAIDPSIVSAKLAQKRIERAAFPVEYLALKGEEIPAESGAFDSVVSTFTLCTIPGIVEAIRGVARVLKPRGQLIFFELGLAPDREVQRWQNRLAPLHHWLFQGLYLTRDIPALIRQGGFQIEQMESGYVAQFPKSLSYCWWGTAMAQS